MFVSEAITRIKRAGHDISDEYSTDDCIGFLNHAIQKVSAILIELRSPLMVNEILVHEGESVPQNFMRLAGSHPLRITGDTFYLLDDLEHVRMRYFATKPNISDLPLDGGEQLNLPFANDAINEIIVKTAVILALNDNEYDVSQDNNLKTELEQNIMAAMR